MPNHKENIWSTLETFCWSADLPYEDYQRLHKSNNCTYGILCKEAFQLFCQAMQLQLEKDMDSFEDKDFIGETNG